ncbi:phosphoribosylformylglycinamidine cyclo-ligase [uncultured Helicobacter sp.]|uniref:phosphoribosylformylglycinamidine cyclo-ligase n=1 Tax=uncultured Helicobacter sp. TaxID=175537 RepID=UPI001C3B3DBB|nr:phosphoribosylformylglycinamidine cyclo-ligase [Candidatus Helicobacter avicola]
MLSYKDSGVDIDEGNALVDGLKPLVQSTFDTNVIGGIGSFAGAYAMPSGYKQPVILGATDGVGTKLRLAIDSGILENVGIDLVAMCVNDLICNFATPIFFLDYYATGKLDKTSALRVIQGIVEGCKLAQCALIGGESAEMPGMYAPKDFDLAGFAVGIAEREDLGRTDNVQVGDVLVALPSSGLHSNGYSLVRKVLERANLTLDSVFDGMPLAQTLLTPTKIYVKTFLELKNHIKALAHITGGGIVENLPRALPSGLGARIQKNVIKTPPIFDLIQRYVSEEECFRTFNMGIGMIFVVDAKNADFVAKGSGGYVLGHIDSQSGVKLQ